MDKKQLAINTIRLLSVEMIQKRIQATLDFL